MIVRTWRCQATGERADEYQWYLLGTVFASLERIAGHRGGQLLRRDLGVRVEFVAITYWDLVEAIREYAGQEIGVAVVKPEARAMLAAFDETVDHYALAHDSWGGSR